MTTLAHCGTCHQHFVPIDFPELPVPLKTPRAPSTWDTIYERIFGKTETPTFVFRFPCGDIFHYHCLGEHMDAAEKPCPNCRDPIPKTRVGKQYSQLIEVFLKALKHDPTIVTSQLQNPTKETGICTICRDPHPFVPLRFDGKQFHHEKCSRDTPVKLEDLVKIVQKVVKEHHYLKKWFTPSSLSFNEYYRLTYPRLYKAAAILLVSTTALVINRLHFNGQNTLLSIAGFPGYLALLAVQHTTYALAMILNSQEA